MMKKNDIVTLWLGSPDAGDTAPIEVACACVRVCVCVCMCMCVCMCVCERE